LGNPKQALFQTRPVPGMDQSQNHQMEMQVLSQATSENNNLKVEFI
jgi:hypothetical protein